MKTLLNTINILFIIILIISFLSMMIVIIYTFVDLCNNTYFDISSKHSIELFFDSFVWGKSIIGSTIILISVFYAYQTFKVYQENILISNYIMPKEKEINLKLSQIKNTNKKLYEYCKINSRIIMKTIISKEKNNRIENRDHLEKYFNKYVKKHVGKFECSGYFGTNCSGDCNMCKESFDQQSKQNSFDQFNTIAFDLFCISYEYTDYEEDLKDIYLKNIYN